MCRLCHLGFDSRGQIQYHSGPHQDHKMPGGELTWSLMGTSPQVATVDFRRHHRSHTHHHHHHHPRRREQFLRVDQELGTRVDQVQPDAVAHDESLVKLSSIWSLWKREELFPYPAIFSPERHTQTLSDQGLMWSSKTPPIPTMNWSVCTSSGKRFCSFFGGRTESVSFIPHAIRLLNSKSPPPQTLKSALYILYICIQYYYLQLFSSYDLKHTAKKVSLIV